MKTDMVLRQRKAAAKQVEAAVREHGKTTPMKLEEKRLRLSQTEQLVEAQIAQIQSHRHLLDRDKKLTPEIAFNLDMAVLDLRWKAGVINGLGAIVDCLSTRLFIKTKKGKSGHRRYSIANYFLLDQRFDELETIVESLKKLSGYEPPDEDEEGTDEIDEDEAEIVEEKK